MEIIKPAAYESPNWHLNYSSKGDSLGKSRMDGKRGRNDPGDISPGNIFRKDFSNLKHEIKIP